MASELKHDLYHGSFIFANNVLNQCFLDNAQIVMISFIIITLSMTFNTNTSVHLDQTKR